MRQQKPIKVIFGSPTKVTKFAEVTASGKMYLVLFHSVEFA